MEVQTVRSGVIYAVGSGFSALSSELPCTAVRSMSELTHSTMQQLLVFLESIYKSFGSNAQGITGSLWKWFRGYLSSRMQCVTLNHCISDLLLVVSGVPQGSILGPLLFLIFVNDLPMSVTSSSIFLFAVDTKCLLPVKTFSDCLSLQRDLHNLSLWSLNWKMEFQRKQMCSSQIFFWVSTYIMYGYNINGHDIAVQENHKDLGIIMYSALSWSEHIKYILSKA